jgi:hypothetical protein
MRGEFTRQVKARYLDATARPRSELTGQTVGFRFIEDYVNRCTAPTDRVFVVGDKASFPYVSQRRIFRSTDFHEGVFSADRPQRSVANALASAHNVPVYVSEMPGGPLAALSQDHIRTAARQVFGDWRLVNETPVRPTQQFWIGFSRTYPFDSVDPRSGWPCYRGDARAATAK